MSRRTFSLAALVLAGALAGCAPPEVDLFADDPADLDQVRSVRIKLTTIGGVEGEDYPEVAWVNVQRKYKQPYYPLSMGRLFAWDFLDEMADGQQDAKPAKKREEREKRTKRKPKPKPKQVKKAEPEKAEPQKTEPEKAKPESADDEGAAPEVAAEPDADAAPSPEPDSAPAEE
jgi:spore germination cell wall hydrolase CwlJ-like protein